MALQIVFGDQIKPVFVAKVVETRVVGIVRGSYSVDVVALHHQDIFKHGVIGDGAAVILMGVVPVHALDHDLGSVDKELAGFDPDGAEADFQRLVFDCLALSVFQGDQQRVEDGRFGCPFEWIGDFFDEFDIFAGFGRKRGAFGAGRDSFAGGRKDFVFHGQALCLFGGEVAEGHGQIQFGVAAFRVELCFREEVEDIRFGNGQQPHFAEKPAEPPHVLILDITCVGPLYDLSLNGVFAGLGPYP